MTAVVLHQQHSRPLHMKKTVKNQLLAHLRRDTEFSLRTVLSCTLTSPANNIRLCERLKADVSSVSLHPRSDKGLTLETSAFKLSTMANSRYQLS